MEVGDIEDDEVKGEKMMMLRMMALRRRKMMMLRTMMLGVHVYMMKQGAHSGLGWARTFFL